MSCYFTIQEAQQIIDKFKPHSFDEAFNLLFRYGYTFGEPDQFIAYDNASEEWCICTFCLDAQRRDSFMSVEIIIAASEME